MNPPFAQDAHPRRMAAAAVLEAYREGRPTSELSTLLPEELEAIGQHAAAAIVRAFFARPVPQALREAEAAL